MNAGLKLYNAENTKKYINCMEKNRFFSMLCAFEKDVARLECCINDITDLHEEMFAYSKTESMPDKTQQKMKPTELSAKCPLNAAKSSEYSNNDPCNDRKRQKIILRIPKSVLIMAKNIRDESFRPVETQEHSVNEMNNNANLSEHSTIDDLWNAIKAVESSEDKNPSGHSEYSTDDQCNIKNPQCSTDDQCNIETNPQCSTDDHCYIETNPQCYKDYHCNIETNPQCSTNDHCNPEIKQQCSRDDQCNIETMQQYSVDDHCNIETMQQCSVDDQCNIEAMQQCSVDDQYNIEAMQQCSVDDQCNIETMQQCSVDDQCNIEAMQQCSVDDQINIESMKQCSLDMNYTMKKPEYSVDVPYNSIKTPEYSTSESCNTIETQEYSMNENIHLREWFVAPNTSDAPCNTMKEVCNIELAKTHVTELLGERENEISLLVLLLIEKIPCVKSTIHTVRNNVTSTSQMFSRHSRNVILSKLEDIGTSILELDTLVSLIHKKYADILDGIS